MRKLLILIILVISITGHSQNRYHWDETINNEDGSVLLLTSTMSPINGVVYDEHESDKRKKKLSFEASYKNGVNNGFYKEWHENGYLKFEGNFKDGWEYGVQKIWHINGQLAFQGNFVKGKSDGLHKEWYETGQLKSEKYWKKGKLISERCFDFSNNKIKCEY